MMVFLHTRSVPLYLLPASYLLLSMIFPDRWAYGWGLLLAVVLYLGTNNLGKQLSFLIFKTADPTLYLPLGLGSALLICYFLFCFSTKQTVFYLVWASLAILAVPEWEVLRYRVLRRYSLMAPFLLLAIWTTFTPAVSYEALVHHLGLPHQYLAIGRMKIIPENTLSASPPLDQVLNLLFVGMKGETGIKVFSVILYFHLISLLSSLLRWILSDQPPGGNGQDRSFWPPTTRTELILIPMLILPAAWLQIHLLYQELLMALFFCAAISTLVKEFDFLSDRKILTVALLFALSVWTGWASLLYIAFCGFLWFALNGWTFTRQEWKRLGLLYGMTILFLSPLIFRNYQATGGIAYPASWTNLQKLSFYSDTFQSSAKVQEILVAPLLLTFKPRLFGIGSEISLLLLFTLVIYPFTSGIRTLSRIGIYIFVCYLLWLYTLHHFPSFLPVFLLVFPITYLSLRFLERYPCAVVACLILSSLFSLYQLYPYYTKHYPVLLPHQSMDLYLKKNLSYYQVADILNKERSYGRIMLVGVNGMAYFRKELIAPGPYDIHPLENLLLTSSSVEDLFYRLKAKRVDLIVFSLEGFQEQVNRYGVLPVDLFPEEILKGQFLVFENRSETGIPLRKLPRDKKILWKDFLQKYSAIRKVNGFFILRLSQ